MRIDAATGAIKGQVDNCHAAGDNLGDRPLVFADAGSYVLFQGDAIASYAGP